MGSKLSSKTVGFHFMHTSASGLRFPPANLVCSKEWFGQSWLWRIISQFRQNLLPPLDPLATFCTSSSLFLGLLTLSGHAAEEGTL